MGNTLDGTFPVMAGSTVLEQNNIIAKLGAFNPCKAAECKDEWAALSIVRLKMRLGEHETLVAIDY